MKNKKGLFTLTVTLGMIIVAAILIFLSFLGIGIFAALNIYKIIGAGIIVLTFIYAIPAALKSDFTTTKVIFIMMLFGVGVLVIFLPEIGLFQQAFTGEAIPQLAIPHMASYKCEKIGEANGIVRNIPTSGVFITETTLGFYAPSIRNVVVELNNPSYSDYDYRVKYKICEGSSCTTEYREFSNGQKQMSLPSITIVNKNYDKYSLTITVERDALYWVGGWSTTGDISTISYDADKYGLTLYSTTQDPAGAVICSTGCDLNCPSQSYRDKLLYTLEYTLLPLETAPYLEYWEDINYNVNMQGGATVYSESKDEFCFAGVIYSSNTLKMDNGVTYIYPNTATRQTKTCCPGAVIAITNGEKICQTDYTWKTITQEQQTGQDCITCISDINCFGGLTTCEYSNNKFYTSGWRCNSGCCIKEELKEVDCCPPDLGCIEDQICQTPEYKCVGGTSDVPISTGGITNKTTATTKDACEARNAPRSYRYQWIETTQESAWYEIWRPKTTTTGYCKDTYMIYYILGGILGFILLITIILVVSKKSPSPQPYYQQLSQRRNNRY